MKQPFFDDKCRAFYEMERQGFVFCFNREKYELARKYLRQPMEHLCIENPTPLSYFGLPYYLQVVQPFQFGDPFKKRTCLWLKGLPLLRKTRYVEPICSWVERTSSSTIRARAFPGIAEAMADQWSRFVT